MLTAFDHVTVAVTDLEAAIAAHAAVLGAPPFWRGEHPDHGTHSALFALRNAAIELVAPKPSAAGEDDDAQARAEGLRAWLAQTGGGLQAVAFATDSAEQLSAQLRERGVRSTKPQAGEARSLDGAQTRRYQTVELSPRTTRGLSVLAVERPEPLIGLHHVAASSQADALDHVVLRTANIDAARALYGEALGIRLALERDLRGTRMLFFRIGGVTLEVVLDPSLGDSDALWGLAFRVADIEAAHARMLAAGLSLSEIRDGLKAQTRIFTVREGVCNVPTLILRDPSRDSSQK